MYCTVICMVWYIYIYLPRGKKRNTSACPMELLWPSRALDRHEDAALMEHLGWSPHGYGPMDAKKMWTPMRWISCDFFPGSTCSTIEKASFLGVYFIGMQWSMETICEFHGGLSAPRIRKTWSSTSKVDRNQCSSYFPQDVIRKQKHPKRGFGRCF